MRDLLLKVVVYVVSVMVGAAFLVPVAFVLTSNRALAAWIVLGWITPLAGLPILGLGPTFALVALAMVMRPNRPKSRCAALPPDMVNSDAGVEIATQIAAPWLGVCLAWAGLALLP